MLRVVPELAGRDGDVAELVGGDVDAGTETVEVKVVAGLLGLIDDSTNNE